MANPNTPMGIFIIVWRIEARYDAFGNGRAEMLLKHIVEHDDGKPEHHGC